MLPGGYPAIYPALQDDGGERLDPARHVRRGTGRGAVRDDRRRWTCCAACARIRRSRRRCIWRPAIRRIPTASLLAWPRTANARRWRARPGASVVLVNGQLAAFLRRRNPAIRVLLPENEPERTRMARASWRRNWRRSRSAGRARRTGLLIGEINDAPAREHFLARFLEEAGFVELGAGLPDAPRGAGDRAGAEKTTMPEGDTIFRTARTLHRAIGGQAGDALRIGAAETGARGLRHAAGGPHGGEGGDATASGC